MSCYDGVLLVERFHSPEHTPSAGVKPSRKEGNASRGTMEEVELRGGEYRIMSDASAQARSVSMTHLFVADARQV